MVDISTMIVTIISSILASSGLWSVILFKLQSKDVKEKAKLEALLESAEEDKRQRESDRELLMALAHDKIYHLGKKFLQQYSDGEIEYMDAEELVNFEKLYGPYAAGGGNGLCKMVHDEVQKIPRVKPRDDNDK